ncbi:hypothetical protein CR513_33443, partial [Mucuna pruriens]
MLILDEFLGALRVHEVHLFETDKIKDNDLIATKVEDSKHKHRKSNFDNSHESSSGSTNDEVSLMSKRFKRMLKKKGRKKDSSLYLNSGRL